MVSRILTCLSLFLISSFAAFAQTPEALLQQAEQSFQANDFDAALGTYQSAASAFEQQKQWDNYLKCGAGIANSQRMSGDMEAALATADQFIKKGEQNAAQSEQMAFLYKAKGAVYYAQNDFRQAEINLRKALDIRQKATPDNPDLVREYANLGQIYRLLNDFNKADIFLQKALSIAKSNNIQDANIIGFLYENLGIVNTYKGFYAEALNFLNEASQINNTPDRNMSIFINKARIFVLEKNTKESLKELRKGLQIFNKNTNIHQDSKVLINLGELYSIMADVWEIEEKLDSSAFYYQKAAALNSPHKIDYMLEIVDVALRQQQPAQAKTNLEQGSSLISNVPQKSGINASFQNVFSHYHQSIGDYPAAFAAAQQSLVATINGYDNTDVWSLPSENNLNAAISLDYLTDALANKARVFYNAFKAGKAGQKELDAALQTLFVFDKAVNLFRSQSNAQGTGLSWSDLTLDAYSNAMDICWELWQLTKNEQYKLHAFYFTEKSKSMGLLEAFQKAKATKMAGLSTEEMQRESNLKLFVSETEQQLYALKQDRRNADANAPKIQSLEKLLLEQKQAYDSFIKELQNKHPQYFNLKHNIQIVGIEEVRAMLQPDQALLEYFVADSSAYVLKVTAGELDIYRIDAKEKEIQSLVNAFRSSVYDYFLKAERTDEIYTKLSQQYVESAHKLYQKLVAVAGNLPRRLMVVPSGALSDLPFDALLTEMPAEATQYSKHAYLLRKHIVAYCYSATLLQEMRNRQHRAPKGDLLAFAPTFGESAAAEIRGERFSLSPLVFNGTEVDKISALIPNGKVFKDKEATEANMRQNAADYRILHFATHGMANDKNADYSLLAFTGIEDNEENEFLYVRELYDMELNADLVVLSACETGIGKLYRGEGVVSLARGFSYAGAKGIFTTLWSVNDQATSQIIESFYQYLAQGKDKDEALNLAKLDFIDKGNSANTHPFLWAPFVLVGDTSKVEGIGNSGTPWWYWAAGAGGLLVVAALLMRRRNKER